MSKGRVKIRLPGGSRKDGYPVLIIPHCQELQRQGGK